MAQIRLQFPEPFNFKTPDNWPRWKKRFLTSGLAGESPVEHTSVLHGRRDIIEGVWQCSLGYPATLTNSREGKG